MICIHTKIRISSLNDLLVIVITPKVKHRCRTISSKTYFNRRCIYFGDLSRCETWALILNVANVTITSEVLMTAMLVLYMMQNYEYVLQRNCGP